MFDKYWDKSVGLWWSDTPAHNPTICDLNRVHPMPNAVNRLLVAAQGGRLREIDVARVLKNLRAVVWTGDDPLFGCVKWYWEEDRPHDTNAAFFVGLPFVALVIVHGQLFSTEEKADIDWILDKLLVWFLRSCEEKHEFYPNKYLGDLVCAWLILECVGGAGRETVADSMRRAAAYWSGKGGWGWGEHLGSYINILLDELSVLLTLATTLPDDLRKSYLGMLNELVALQDNYRDGPPVPALRSYAFTESPKHHSYREYVRRRRADEEISITNRAPLSDLLAEKGWHELVNCVQEPSTAPVSFSVPCFQGAVANAYVEKDIRLGGMSRFPIMDWAEGNGWGLSWQCFPVALWRPDGDWGFLLWHASEGGIRRSQPLSEPLNAKAKRQLTEMTAPPVVGRTETILHGNDLVAVRHMPLRSTAWTSFGDGFRIIRTSAKAQVEQSDGAWSRLTLRWPERVVSVEFVNLTDGNIPNLVENDFNGYDWLLEYDIATPGPATSLWRIRLNEEETGVPVIEPSGLPAQSRPEGGVDVRVRWQDRQFLIDPLADPKLQEEVSGGTRQARV